MAHSASQDTLQVYNQYTFGWNHGAISKYNSATLCAHRHVGLKMMGCVVHYWHIAILRQEKRLLHDLPTKT